MHNSGDFQYFFIQLMYYLSPAFQKEKKCYQIVPFFRIIFDGKFYL